VEAAHKLIADLADRVVNADSQKEALQICATLNAIIHEIMEAFSRLDHSLAPVKLENSTLYQIMAQIQKIALDWVLISNDEPDKKKSDHSNHLILSLYQGLSAMYALCFKTQRKSPEILVMMAQFEEDIPGKGLAAKEHYEEAIKLATGQRHHTEAVETARERLKDWAKRRLTPSWLRI
jgi:hypothetical protein